VPSRARSGDWRTAASCRPTEACAASAGRSGKVVFDLLTRVLVRCHRSAGIVIFVFFLVPVDVRVVYVIAFDVKAAAVLYNAKLRIYH
jgi:hypothetical protein